MQQKTYFWCTFNIEVSARTVGIFFSNQSLYLLQKCFITTAPAVLYDLWNTKCVDMYRRKSLPFSEACLQILQLGFTY